MFAWFYGDLITATNNKNNIPKCSLAKSITFPKYQNPGGPGISATSFRNLFKEQIPGNERDYCH